ncbi:MAG: hypothetical protein HDR00_03010 [Lachnospiraceae bacterium]|nr:hypothetical protein [Lachnospiraceae bacterium]
MKNPTKEFVMIRMAEPLEDELRKRKVFKKKQAKLQDILLNWNGKSEMTQKQLEAFNQIEDALSEYVYLYGETAYRLGYSDGLSIGIDQNPSNKRTLLSLEDMTNLVSIYAAVKKLKITLFGSLDISPEKDSVIGLLDYVFDVINNGVCSKIELLGEDISTELITNILGNSSSSSEEKAKQLLGISKYSK